MAEINNNNNNNNNNNKNKKTKRIVTVNATVPQLEMPQQTCRHFPLQHDTKTPSIANVQTLTLTLVFAGADQSTDVREGNK